MATATQDDLGADADAPGPAAGRPGLVARVRRAGADQLAVGFLVVAVTITALVIVSTHWTPVGDDALLELKVRDVPSHLPLIGVYSRFGWSHPGPLQFWLLAVPYRLFGSASALLLGALLGQLVSVVVAWWLARRISLVAAWAVLIAMVAVLVAVPGDLVRSPWNPFVALAASGTVLVAAWATAERKFWGPIGLAVFGSYLVQAHVTTLPLVGILSVTGLALALWPRATHETAAPPVSRRSYQWAVGAAVLLWVGPLVDQFTSPRPNASILQMGSSSGPRLGASNAVGVLTQSFAVVPSWLRPGTASAIHVDQRLTVPLWLIVPIAGLVIAIVRRDRTFVRGSIVAGAGLAALVATHALVTYGLFGYLVIEDRTVAALSIAIGVASILRHAPRSWARPMTVAAAALVVALTVALCIRVLASPNPVTYEAEGVDRFTSVIERNHDRSERIVVQFNPGDYSRRISPGLMNELERDGYEVRLRGGAEILVGRHRIAPRGWGDVDVLVFSTGDPDMDGLAEEGWKIVDAYDGTEPIRLAVRETAPG